MNDITPANELWTCSSITRNEPPKRQNIMSCYEVVVVLTVDSVLVISEVDYIFNCEFRKVITLPFGFWTVRINVYWLVCLQVDDGMDEMDAVQNQTSILVLFWWRNGLLLKKRWTNSLFFFWTYDWTGIVVSGWELYIGQISWIPVADW